ncbi:MAG: protein-L-isoaspartate(D-aspartate) O-methyltransferase [Opitutae bacterium]|nr:protein-L-isoaspartate(D-aspartate) O-methyltransferase [Opitutae bacterium]MBC9890173.1 protein-L-isoaspartate(D-aspartate) O-methyltransferase [Opitutae bacterium]
MGEKSVIVLLTAAILWSGSEFLAAQEEELDKREKVYATKRMKMVDEQIARRGVRDKRVLEAMRVVKRHELVPERYRSQAYDDHPLPIGEGQTISQPYIVGLMSELLSSEPGEKILEIGTGSGYQAAVLAEMDLEVYTIEIIEALAARAAGDLKRMGYPDVRVRWGDGYAGWPSQAPFDGIIITAAPPKLPQPLIEQTKVGGRIVVPEGKGVQDLNVYTRQEDGSVTVKRVIPVRFVPMTGKAQKGN